MEQWSSNRIRSPFANVNNFLSSMTVFIFSIHTGSMSPSKQMYRCSCRLYAQKLYYLMRNMNYDYYCTSPSIGWFESRKIFANNPSIQSAVLESKYPYSSATEQAFELNDVKYKMKHDRNNTTWVMVVFLLLDWEQLVLLPHPFPVVLLSTYLWSRFCRHQLNQLLLSNVSSTTFCTVGWSFLAVGHIEIELWRELRGDFVEYSYFNLAIRPLSYGLFFFFTKWLRNFDCD